MINKIRISRMINQNSEHDPFPTIKPENHRHKIYFVGILFPSLCCHSCGHHVEDEVLGLFDCLKAKSFCGNLNDDVARPNSPPRADAMCILDIENKTGLLKIISMMSDIWQNWNAHIFAMGSEVDPDTTHLRMAADLGQMVLSTILQKQTCLDLNNVS